LKIVENVLQRSSHSKPADTVLRAELKLQTGLPPELAASAARAVFAWFRWRGWLEESQSIGEQVQQALLLQARFARAPSQFSDHELLAQAIPPWVSGEMDIRADWLQNLQREPRLWLRARPGKGKELAGKLGECWIPGSPALADTVEYRGQEDLFRIPEFHAGEFEVQDINSQIVSLACAPKPSETWWDACAGEGGKLLHLSDLMGNKGLIWASDRAEWRLKRLKLRAARAKVFNYRSAIWDGGEKLPTRTKFDGVLIDAPCSGIGTWQRNPHARWTTTANDVKELAGVQKRLLRNVADSVKPGGKLIYAVCTLTRAETVEVASAFEKEFPEFKKLPLLSPLRPEAEAGWPLWLWPEDGGNGMFVVAWNR
jgi:16S rRNA (cytosine967-C5)-methyltransferase